LTIDEMPELVARQAAIHELRVLPVSYGTVVGLLDRLGLTGRREGFTWERHLNW
jgi:hypothetical protein